MNGFVKRVRYPLALLGGSRSKTTGPDTSGSEYDVTELGLDVNYLNTDSAKGSSCDGLQLGAQVQI